MVESIRSFLDGFWIFITKDLSFAIAFILMIASIWPLSRLGKNTKAKLAVFVAVVSTISLFSSFYFQLLWLQNFLIRLSPITIGASIIALIYFNRRGRVKV